jgi:CHASE3 domain sensor protein
MAPDIRRRTWFAVLLPLSALLVAAVLFGWQVEYLSRLDTWVDHSDRVIGRIDRVQKLLLDQETSVRGYLLTHQRDFLQPWEVARRELPSTFSSARELVADNDSQLRRLNLLERRHAEWQATALSAIEGFDAGRLAPAAPAAAFVESLRQRKAMMDQMRSIVNSSLEEEHQLLVQRRVHAATRTSFARWAGGILLIMVGLIVASIVRRQIRLIAESHARALADERRSRQAAEALVAEVRQQSVEVEANVRQNTEARERAEARLTELTRASHSIPPVNKG